MKKHVVNVNQGAISVSQSGALGFQVTVRIPGGYTGVDLSAAQLAELVSEADKMLPEEKRIGR